VTGLGRPALAMMWFLVEDDRLWFHTPEPPNAPAPFLRAAREGREVTVSYPGLEDSPTIQWSKPSELFSLRPDTTSAEQR
jgi:hypothetical protein